MLIVTKGENADDDQLKTIMNAFVEGAKMKMAKECPKEIGETLVWYPAKFKMPKENEDRASAFSEAYTHLAKDSSVSVVIVPDEEAVALADEKLKDADPKAGKPLKALLAATGYCIFTEFGVAAEPALKILVLAADADGAVTLNKAATTLIDEGKKAAPPPVQAVLKSLVSVQVGANVQMSINIGDLVKAVTAMAGGAPEAPAAPADK